MQKSYNWIIALAIITAVAFLMVSKIRSQFTSKPRVMTPAVFSGSKETLVPDSELRFDSSDKALDERIEQASVKYFKTSSNAWWKLPTRRPTAFPTLNPISRRPSYIPTQFTSTMPTGKAEFGLWSLLSPNSSFPARQWHSSICDHPSRTIYTIGGTAALHINMSASFSDIWAYNTVSGKHSFTISYHFIQEFFSQIYS